MDRLSMDQSIQVLQAQKNVWTTLPLPRKIRLLFQLRERLDQRSDRWVEAAVRAKQIDPQSPWVGEEWVTGPWALATAINGYLETLQALVNGHLPELKQVTTRSNGQVVAQVFPRTIYDRLLFSGVRAEVWMQPGVTARNLGASMASFYNRPDPRGGVALVLGAGNINSISPLDVVYRLYACGHVVLLKMNPVNAYLGPILEEIFEPFVQAGFIRFAYGGADIGTYLTQHAGIEAIHMTGSARTHDTIVYGPGAIGAERKQRNEPLLQKPITSELGGVGPTIIVPGPWSAADIRYQAENVVTMKLHNGGFNCVASQILIMPADWDQREVFLDAVRHLLRTLPARSAYYPGAAERQQEAVVAYPNAEVFGGDVPRTLITNVDPAAEQACFSNEFFGAVLAETRLPGNTIEYLRNAVQLCNDKLDGTLGATLLIHPKTMQTFQPEVDDAIADLRYGSIGINVWNAMAFLLAQSTWGAYPGHSYANIQSGIGVVRNSFLFDKPEKSVVYSSFYAFPRSWLHGDFSLLPRPPWFVTNKTAQQTARRVAKFAADPGLRHVPGIFLSAIKG